jgi:RNAse (barnase) inhibitor barstar
MKGLFTLPLRGGAYDVADEEALTDRLRRAGWHVGAVDLTDARMAVVMIGDELGFPDYYGKNLDALHDCLGDLERPTALVIHLPTGLGRYGQAMLEILVDRAESAGDVPFALVRLVGSPSS